MPIGAWVGALLLLAVLLLALRRPLFAVLGWNRATEQPRQLALIAIGLMVATAVVAGASITADSIGHSEGQAALEAVGDVDVVAQPSRGSMLTPDSLEEIVSDDRVDPLVDTHAGALRVSASASDAATGLGEPEVLVWGVEPRPAQALGLLDPIRGAIPADQTAWGSGIILNEGLADRLDAGLGDRLTLYIDAPPDQDVSWENRTGQLVAAARTPDGGYTHSPQDTYVFDVEVDGGSSGLHLRTTADSQVDLDLEVVHPNGSSFLFDDGTPQQPVHANVTLTRADLAPGTWSVRVHAKQAAGATFQLHVALIAPPSQGAGSIPVEGELIAVVDDPGTDPLGRGDAASLVALLAREHLAASTGAGPGLDTVLLSATDASRSSELATAFEQVASEQTDARGEPLDVRAMDARSQAVEDAQEGAPWLKVFFLTLGSFSILAGFLLIVSLMAMLIEERKPELATMRATGATRGQLTQVHLHEGAVYALAAALAGLAVAVALAWFIVRTAGTFSFYEGLDMELVVDPWTVAGSVGAGLALTLVVVGLAAYRASRFNIARALTGEQDAPRELTRRAWLGYGAVLLAGVALSTYAVLDGDPMSVVLGPPLAAVGLAGLLARRFPREIVYPLVGSLVLAYTAGTFLFLTELTDDVDFLLIPVRGLLITVAASLVLVWMDWPARLAAWLVSRIKRLEPVADPAFSYAHHRRTRTSLTVSMIALVILVLVMTSTVYAMFSPNLGDEAGGFDVVATSGVPIEDAGQWLANQGDPDARDVLDRVERIVVVPRAENAGWRAHVGDAGLSTAGPRGDQADMLGVTPALVDAQDFQAAALAPEHPTMDAAMDAVAEDPNLTIVSDAFRIDDGAGGNRGLVPGDVLSLPGREGTVNLTIVGIQEGGVFGGILVHPSTVEALGTELTSRFFVTAAGGEDPAALAKDLESAFRAARMDALSIAEAEAEAQADVQAQLTVLQAFLGTGLLVGIAAIGIITARNVLERRGEVGVLRALGAQRSHIAAIFTIETLFVVALGIVIGLAGGLLAAYGAFLTSFEETGAVFTIDWTNLAVVIALAVAVALVAAMVPARRASRLTPAEATRIVG